MITRPDAESCKAIGLQGCEPVSISPPVANCHALNMDATATIPDRAEESARCSPDIADLSLESDHDLLTRLFRLEMPREEARRLAGESLDRYGGLRNLLESIETGPFHRQNLPHSPHSCRWAEVLALCRELFKRRLLEGLSRGSALTSPADTLDYLQSTLQGRRREIFQCMFLDTRHRVICSEELFQGSIDGACVYPRVVAEHALRHNAAAVIVAHNHPSGVTEPSLADQAITRRLKDALALLEIRLLDHFVVGDGTPVSMASRGMI